MTTAISFDGAIPRNYDDYLSGFLFDGFADDIVKRLRLSGDSNILELAAGTGIVTGKLQRLLPGEAVLTVTDLQEGMLQIAKEGIDGRNIRWATVDMTAIPYDENTFDIVVCQFGIMLVPYKLKALQEIYRVLKPGGQLVFSVWGDIAANTVWKIGNQVVTSFIKTNPILQDPGPFSMNIETTEHLLSQAGFVSAKHSVVEMTGTIDSAANAAKGFISGLPVVIAISKNNPALVPTIEQELEKVLIKELGDHPLQSNLQALVFETFK